MRSFDLLERAIALDPDHAPSLADAAFCFQVMDINGIAKDHQENRRRGVEFARRALQVSDDPEPVATAAFALAYFGQRIDDALALIDHALALNPHFSRGWYMSGMARLYAGQPDRAIESLETAIRLNPRDRLGRRNLAGIGIAQLFQGHLDEAVPLLRLMVQEFPRWATPYAALASCHAHLGQLHDAEIVSHRLKSVDRTLVPNAIQFRDPGQRELLTPGIKMAGGLS
jgi:tetratricopeptide (TPR) repeat protein